MATQKRASTRNHSRLEEALTNLLNNQALLVGQMAGANERSARVDERFARMDERFARIESELAEIKTILLHHQRMLEGLTEAIREKIGFVKPQ